MRQPEQIDRRDWFAGMALNGLLSSGGITSSKERVAQVAVEYADALIAQLDATKPKDPA